MRVRLALASSLVGLVSAGCITAPAWEYGSTAKAKELDVPPCSEQAIIEDGEDIDPRLRVQDGRGGYWFTFVDAEGSRITPVGWPFKMSSPGRNGSKGVVKMAGQMAPSGKSIYAGMGASLTEPPSFYDASKYSGVTFWAKGPGRVRFEMPDVHTAPAGGICKDCYNDFGIVLALEPEWRKYTIRFEWMQQRSGWGDPFPAIQTDQVLAMEWEFNGMGRAFDVQIDDIAFVCEGSTP